MPKTWCRTCANEHNKVDSLNLFKQSNKMILARLRKISGLQLKKQKSMPECICVDCQNHLEQAFAFRQTCKRAQAKLRQFLETKRKLPTAILRSTNNDSENSFIDGSHVKVDPNENLGENVIKFESVKVETDIKAITTTNYNLREAKVNNDIDNDSDSDESLIPIQAVIQCNGSGGKNLDNESIISKSADEDTIGDQNDWSMQESIAHKSMKAKKKKIKAAIAVDDTTLSSRQIPVTNKTAQDKTNKTQKRSEKKSTKSNTETKTNQTLKAAETTISANETKPKSAKFICEMCGQSFNVQHYFESHVNRHKGEQTFACEICPEKYYSQQSLKRHMLKHTGALPNACRFCPRRFLDCSAKVRHERMHTNDRPFKCTYCEKAFTVNYILKNHLLTHTGERPFNCKICKRSFIQKKHLSTHYKSTFHRQNEEKAKAITMPEH